MLVSTKTLTILGYLKSIPFKANENLLDILNANKISINQSCGGNGSCTTCRIITHSDAHFFSERNELETELAIERGFVSNERLACQIQLFDSVTIEIPDDAD